MCVCECVFLGISPYDPCVFGIVVLGTETRRVLDLRCLKSGFLDFPGYIDCEICIGI